MNLSEGLLIRGSDDVDNGLLVAATSRSIGVATSTSSKRMRCFLPLRHACRDLFSSIACAKQVMMNAVNDNASPVFALCSRRSRCVHIWNSKEEHGARGKVHHNKGISHSWRARHHIPNRQVLPCGIDGGGTVPSRVIQMVVTIPPRTVTAHLDQPWPDMIWGHINGNRVRRAPDGIRDHLIAWQRPADFIGRCPTPLKHLKHLDTLPSRCTHLV